MLVEHGDVLVVQHDVEFLQILGQSSNLDVGAVSDDDRVIPVAHERLDRPMRHVHERTRRFDDLEAERAGVCQRPFGGAMGGDHHGRRPDLPDIVHNRDAFVT